MDDLSLSDLGMSEEDIKKLSRAELDAMPYDRIHWTCAHKGCNSKSAIRDYGLEWFYYWPRSKSWINPWRTVRFCGKHWQLYKAHYKLHKALPQDDNIRSGNLDDTQRKSFNSSIDKINE